MIGLHWPKQCIPVSKKLSELICCQQFWPWEVLLIISGVARGGQGPPLPQNEITLCTEVYGELPFWVPVYPPPCRPLILKSLATPLLTAHNWQKWKRIFLTCPCHKIDRDEAVGLKSCKYTWKITIFVKMWNLGQYREIWYFVNNCLIVNIIVIIWSTAHFVST